MRMSIVPNFELKMLVTDKVKKRKLEFRKLPCLDLTVALTNSYPSHSSPMLAISGKFYQPYKQKILESLKGRWSEETPVLYDMVCYIQDEMIEELINECPDLMPTDDSGNIKLSFDSSEEFEEAYN